MIEIQGDFWSVYKQYDVICVTTNGVIKKNGELVMGAGIAKQFNLRFKNLAKLLGEAVQERGNIPLLVRTNKDNPVICTFPTKHHWREMSDIKLILRSAQRIKEITKGASVLATKPGCGNGGLDWRKVKKYLSQVWNEDRFTIISP